MASFSQIQSSLQFSAYLNWLSINASHIYPCLHLITKILSHENRIYFVSVTYVSEAQWNLKIAHFDHDGNNICLELRILWVPRNCSHHNSLIAVHASYPTPRLASPQSSIYKSYLPKLAYPGMLTLLFKIRSRSSWSYKLRSMPIQLGRIYK